MKVNDNGPANVDIKLDDDGRVSFVHEVNEDDNYSVQGDDRKLTSEQIVRNPFTLI